MNKHRLRKVLVGRPDSIKLVCGEWGTLMIGGWNIANKEPYISIIRDKIGWKVAIKFKLVVGEQADD
jgi:hypothetical protein